jgi:hypothetical protein
MYVAFYTKFCHTQSVCLLQSKRLQQMNEIVIYFFLFLSWSQQNLDIQKSDDAQNKFNSMSC